MRPHNLQCHPFLICNVVFNFLPQKNKLVHSFMKQFSNDFNCQQNSISQQLLKQFVHCTISSPSTSPVLTLKVDLKIWQPIEIGHMCICIPMSIDTNSIKTPQISNTSFRSEIESKMRHIHSVFFLT